MTPSPTGLPSATRTTPVTRQGTLPCARAAAVPRLAGTAGSRAGRGQAHRDRARRLRRPLRARLAGAGQDQHGSLRHRGDKLGSSPHGQSHQTTFAQIAADALGISPDVVQVLHGDSAKLAGTGTYGSRSVTVGGSALVTAAEEVRERAKQAVALALEVSPRDLLWDGGRRHVAGSPEYGMTLAPGRPGRPGGRGGGPPSAGRCPDPEGQQPVLPPRLGFPVRRPCRCRRGGPRDRDGETAMRRNGG